MREIVNLQFGQCGNQIGSKFWEVITEEHNITAEGSRIFQRDDVTQERSEVYFQELRDRRHVPRAVLVDLEPGPLDAIRGSAIGSMFRPDNFIYDTQGAGNNWATGYLTRGASKIDVIFDAIRKEAERCDCLQGFQIFHSLGGGTGSGLGTLTLGLLREEFPDRMLCNVSVFPSPKVSDVVVEPYNSILALDQLIEWSDEVFCMDNEALYNICINNLKMKRISYGSLNNIIAQTMSGVTTTLRFPGQLNADLRKLAVNMIPFPRLHFFLTGLSPLKDLQSRSFCNESVEQVTKELFDPRNIMCDCNPGAGRYLTFAAMYRGKHATRDVDEQLYQMQNKHSSFFVEWIPNNAKVSVCSVPPKGHKLSATLLANNTALQDVMRRIKDQFTRMFRRQAFVHWYMNEGLDSMAFLDADSNLSDLIAEYQQYTEMPVHEKDGHFDDLTDSLEDLDSGYGL